MNDSFSTHLPPFVAIEIDFEGQLRGEQAKRLIEHADRYKKEPVELLADIIETVLNDDLVTAVLDVPPP